MQTAEQMANAVLLKEMLKSAFDMPKWDPNVSGMLMGGALGGLGGAAAGYLTSDKEKKNTLRNMLMGGGLGAAALGGIGSMKDVMPAEGVDGSFLGDMASRAVSSAKDNPSGAAGNALTPVLGYVTGRAGGHMFARNIDATGDKFLSNMVAEDAPGSTGVWANKFKNNKVGKIVTSLVNLFSATSPKRNEAFMAALDKYLPDSSTPTFAGTNPGNPRQIAKDMASGAIADIGKRFPWTPTGVYTAADAEATIRSGLGSDAKQVLDYAKQQHLQGSPASGSVLKGNRTPATGSIARGSRLGGRVGGGLGLMAMLYNMLTKNPDVNIQ